MQDLVHRGATELAAMLRGREISAVELLEAHLERIGEFNGAVNAIVTLDADRARAAALDADRRLTAGEEVGPLHGLPIAIKDTHRTAGMRTTRGALSHAHDVPDTSHLHVERILAAGAILFGKTNVPEYAAGSHTVNRVFGATRNPYDLGLSAGGSSGGAAAALASGFQPIADGSDMGGSLRNPASFCNVVGLRPTPGVVPNADGSNLFSPLSTAGPMGRGVDDVELLLRAMSGRSEADPHSFDLPEPGSHRDGRRFGDGGRSLAGLRVAWAPTLGGRIPVDREVLDVIGRQAALVESLGADVEEACPDLDGADEAFETLRAAEFAAEFGEQLANDPDEFNPRLTWNIRVGLGLSGADVIRAQSEMSRLIRACADFFTRYDVVLAPAAQVAPFDVDLDYPHVVDGEEQDSYLGWMRAVYMFTPLGIPAMSLPAGFTPGGKPVGLQMLSARGTDLALLDVARTVEAARGEPWRRPF